MTPATIKKKEDAFFSTLKPNSGVQYTLKSTTDIGGANIYSIRPPYATYFYQTKTKKKSICLHFTVGYIGSDVSTLSKDNSHVSVPYTVDRCGRIYELFDDAYWSYHLGNTAIGGNGTMSKQSIGIEISNYGPLKLSGSNLLDAYGNVYCTLADKDHYVKTDYRGYQYFATMSQEQLDAIVALIKHLCAKHSISMSFKCDDNVFKSATEATSFNGIFYHTNVRSDKFDWPFTDQIQYIIDQCTKTDKPIAEEPTVVAESVVEASKAEPVPAEAPKQTQPAPTSSPAKQPPKAKKTPPPPKKSSATIVSTVIELLETIITSIRR